MEEGKSLESVAGQVLGGQSGMQDGSFPMPRARRKDLVLGRTTLPWSRRQLSEAGKGEMNESRAVNARTFVAQSAKSGAFKTGRANEGARAQSEKARNHISRKKEQLQGAMRQGAGGGPALAQAHARRGGRVSGGGGGGGDGGGDGSNIRAGKGGGDDDGDDDKGGGGGGARPEAERQRQRAAVNDTNAQRTWDDGEGDGGDHDDHDDHEDGEDDGGGGQRQVKRRPISAGQMGGQRAPKDGQRHQRASAASLVHAQPAQGWAGGPPDAQCGRHVGVSVCSQTTHGRLLQGVTVVAVAASRSSTANVAPVHGNRAAMSIPFPVHVQSASASSTRNWPVRPGPCGWPSLAALFRAACALLRSPPTPVLSAATLVQLEASLS
ncbi:hypothetical protein J3E71DRAFT_235863 [Bipolaris maydis]|nr:hypothetical protein J3E71DRAFT_235863 [Bipolaris maydis]